MDSMDWMKERKDYSMIIKEISSENFLKAIDWLTSMINNNNRLNGSQCLNSSDRRSTESINNSKYYLLRSECYRKLQTTEALKMALKDINEAIRLDMNRFQSYLQGALILSELKRFNESLQMFEQSIRLNPDLTEEPKVIKKLFYLKFKVLATHGFDEEMAFTTALTHRYLADCIANMGSKSDHLNVCDFIDLNPNESVLDNICNRFSEPVDKYSENNSENKYLINSINGIDVYSDSMARSESNMHSVPEVSARTASETNERIVSRLTDHYLNESLKSVTISGPTEDISEEQNSLDLEFKDILREDTTPEKKLNRVQTWIDRNCLPEKISKLCHFQEERPSNPVPPIARNGNDHKGANSLTLSDNTLVIVSDSRSQVAQISSESSLNQVPTNVMKLRGIYIGNLKTGCNYKALKELFRKYGIISDFYQPSCAGYAFIHFKSPESATHMITDWQSKPSDECKEGKRLVLRFTPSQEQMTKYNSMSLSDYKKRCNDAHECELWRSGRNCPYNNQCPFKHIAVNRAIDTLPEKRKAVWKH